MKKHKNIANRAVIITPPLYSPVYPQLGPPILKGYANKFHYDFDQVDMNIEFLRFLKAKIKLQIISNPDKQQNPQLVENILIQYFTDRFVFETNKSADYILKYTHPTTNIDNLEQYNLEVGSGLGYNNIVNSSYKTIVDFIKDDKTNYYYQYFEETEQAQKLSNKFNIVGFL